MEFIQILLIAIGLAMDALAVSVCQGLKMKKVTFAKASIIALFFGGFQALMPLLGWSIGYFASNFKTIGETINQFDHWVAFALLALIGGNMIFGAIFKKKDEKGAVDSEDKLNFKLLIIMAVATSIDALAVGLTFALVETNVYLAIPTIGIVTFIICLGGVYIGHKFGDKFSNKAEIVGGIILVLIGLKILLEHLGYLPVF